MLGDETRGSILVEVRKLEVPSRVKQSILHDFTIASVLLDVVDTKEEVFLKERLDVMFVSDAKAFVVAYC